MVGTICQDMLKNFIVIPLEEEEVEIFRQDGATSFKLL
jgi:hypothetical protein